MARSKKQMQVSLSSEAYIHPNVLNLPLHDYRKNSDRKEAGMAQISTTIHF